MGMPYCLANFRRSACSVRYFGLVQGSIAPSDKVLLASGMTRFRSKSTVLPKPSRRGLKQHFTGFTVGQFDGVHDSGALLGIHHNAVHQGIDGLAEIYIEQRF